MTKQEMVRRLENKETHAKSKLECQSGSKGEKVLSVKWNCESYTFHLDLALIAEKAEGLEPTKRNVLSLLASLFDPLGLISPVTVSMKILFQEICSSKLDWDETLTGEIKGKWVKWVKDLFQTGKLKPVGVCTRRKRSARQSVAYMGLGMRVRKIIAPWSTSCTVYLMARPTRD